VGAETKALLARDDVAILTATDARALLERVMQRIQRRTGDRDADLQAKTDEFIDELMETRARLSGAAPPTLRLQEHNGFSPRAVKPAPIFHTREIQLVEGYVRTRDVSLWADNERLEIHLQQFQRLKERKPDPQELLDLMFSKMPMDGMSEVDQFEIPPLARSIATNGLQQAPILSLDGRLLDGNRRVAACHYILGSDEFTSAQKKNVEHILVWQLTEHATPQDEEAIIVALNFETSHKQEWPEYIKARKVYEQWQAALQREPTANSRRLLEIKKELSTKFALGFDTSIVTRYIKMVEVASEFEDHHIAVHHRDKFAVKHRAAKYFQYFDELSKGVNPGGVAYNLNQFPEVKGVVFELLYADKFKNWKQIRDLRFVVDNDEARELLQSAAAAESRTEEQLDAAREKVDNALSIGRVRRAAERSLGANTRIEAFVEWLVQLPVQAFESTITTKNLKLLHSALKLVEGIVASNLARREETEEAQKAMKDAGLA
jgi:hypothetical protein